MMQNTGKHTGIRQGIIFLLFLLPALVCAQNRTQRSSILNNLYNENFRLSLVPVPAFFHGYRVDFDARIKNNVWLQVAPQLNFSTKKVSNIPDGKEITEDAYTKAIQGMCLQINLRYYEPQVKGLYYVAGIGFDYNQIDDVDKEAYLPYHVNSFRWGGQIEVGYNVEMWERTYFDIYIGGAFRLTTNSFDSEASQDVFKSSKIHSWKYCYNGIFMEAGIRISLGF